MSTKSIYVVSYVTAGGDGGNESQSFVYKAYTSASLASYYVNYMNDSLRNDGAFLDEVEGGYLSQEECRFYENKYELPHIKEYGVMFKMNKTYLEESL